MIQAEILLALEEGIKDALKKECKTAGVQNIRDEVDPDQTIRGLLIDIQLEIDQLDIGHDSDRVPTVKIPFKLVLALLVQAGKVDVRDLEHTIRQALLATENTPGVAAAKQLVKSVGVQQVIQKLEDEALSSLPRRKVRKSVKVKGATLRLKGAGIKRES